MKLVPSSNQIFMAHETHCRAFRPGNRLIVHSEGMGWRFIYAALIEEGPCDAIEPAIHHPSFIYYLRHPITMTREIEGSSQEIAQLAPRYICLTPGDVTARWQHSGHVEILQIYLRQSIYEAAVADVYECNASGAQIVPRFAILDPMLEQLALDVRAALKDINSAETVYIDSLAQMIAVHLAKHHSNCSRLVSLATSRAVPRAKMHHLMEFIEENLDRDLTLEVVAGELHISPLYLSRAFKTEVGQSPHQYLVVRRVERAMDLLRNSGVRIADVAAFTGFASQSHLSHWFLRLLGVSPAVYRSQSLTAQDMRCD